MTTVEFVGKHSPQPDKLLYQNDWNNFAPAVGLSWSIPWFGKDKTVLRAGYGIAYQGRFAGGGLGVDTNVGLAQSTNHFANHPTTENREIDLRNVVIPIPERFGPGVLPVVPVTERSQGFTAYDTNMVAPYIQNLTLELQREIARNLTMEVRVKITGTTEFEIRLDAINVLNHPNFANPTMDINSPNFGVIPLPGAPGSTGL